MPLEVKRRKNEEVQMLVKRFFQRMKKSGILYRAKNSLIYKKPISKQLKKRNALRRKEIAKKYENIKKFKNI